MAVQWGGGGTSDNATPRRKKETNKTVVLVELVGPGGYAAV